MPFLGRTEPRVCVLSMALVVAAACGSDPAAEASEGAAGTTGDLPDGSTLDSGVGGSGGGAAGASGAAGTAGSAGSGGTATGGATGSGSAAGSGGTAGSTCNDPGPEPNDTVPKATPLCSSPPCELSCKSNEGGQFSGVIGPGDTDLYTYFGIDSWNCLVDASASSQDSGFDLCVFVRCKDGGDTFIKECKNSSLSNGPDGMLGCCAPTPADIKVEHNCPGLDESSAVYVRIDQATACIAYTVDYHY